MSTEATPDPRPLATPDSGVEGSAAPRPIGAERWVSNSIFERKDERKIGKAMSGSLIAHAVLFTLLLWGGFRAVKAVEPPEKIDVVYLQQPGPSGGGGGSPKPAPPVKTEIPKPATPDPVPIVQPIPDPSLVAPVTTLSNMLQASGVDLASFGGGGSGGGIGSGKGDGVGPGTGGGFGGGAYRPGNGCANPTLVRQVDPKYTSEAMRAKLQGDVEIEAVVQKDGKVGQVQLTRSLDKQFGLDDEAMKAAKGWLFRPAVCQGQAVDMIVTLQLQFRLH
jgi:periplasmic protein TonB